MFNLSILSQVSILFSVVMYRGRSPTLHITIPPPNQKPDIYFYIHITETGNRNTYLFHGGIHLVYSPLQRTRERGKKGGHQQSINPPPPHTAQYRRNMSWVALLYVCRYLHLTERYSTEALFLDVSMVCHDHQTEVCHGLPLFRYIYIYRMQTSKYR